MKMKIKINILICISILANTSLYATNPRADKPDADKFFYDKGFNDGRVEGMRLGYDKAKKEIMKKLRSRLNAIKAMEAGKYLSKKHKITAPQIYQVRRADGSLSVQVKGCRLEGELSPEEIVLLPKFNQEQSNSYGNTHNANSLLPSTYNPRENSVGASNGVFLPGIDGSQYDKPKLANTMTDTVYKYLPNTEFYIKILRTSGFPFTINNGGTNIKVRFNSESEAIRFLNSYDLEPGRDVQ